MVALEQRRNSGFPLSVQMIFRIPMHSSRQSDGVPAFG
jgi:hypothetical protein